MKGPQGKVKEVYHRLLEMLHDSLENFEQQGKPFIYEQIQKLKQELIDFHEVSQEDADLAAQYLKRDLQDAGEFLSDAKSSIKNWVAFDWQFVEEGFLRMFAKVADKTQMELAQLKRELEHGGPVYKTGEVTGLGSFRCLNCGHTVHLHEVSHIPPCPHCHHVEFVRETQ